MPSGFSLGHSSTGDQAEATLLDTHDWRLWEAGIIAMSAGGMMELRSLKDWSIMLREEYGSGENAGQPPAKLADVVYPRALARTWHVQTRASIHDVLNSDDKIVCRINAIEFSLAGERGSVCTGLEFLPLRGYSAETKSLQEAMLAQIDQRPDLLLLLLRHHEERPDTFLSHKTLGLVAGVPFPQASGIMLDSLALVMERCVPGILDDTDTEFLHDFRVCVRKSRAYLSLVKKFIDSQALAPNRSFLKRCGSATTRLRDLDVYALKADYFRTLLPPALGRYLDGFFGWINAERNKALEEVTEFLTSPQYTDGMKQWRVCLEDASAFLEKNDTAAVGRKIISRTYRKVSRAASSITDASPDDDVHDLRIECKKLRYTIEFFQDPVDEPLVGELLSLLKKLQEVLGEFNDLSVQQQWLLDALQEPHAAHSREVDAAIGGLITSLYKQQGELRSRIGRRIVQFSDPGLAQVMRSL